MSLRTRSVRGRAYGDHVHLLGFPLLVLGFAIGAGFYVLFGLWAVRTVWSAWRALIAAYWEHRSRAEVAQQRRRLADVQRLGGRERPLRRAA